jgi:hypothetical protein
MNYNFERYCKNNEIVVLILIAVSVSVLITTNTAFYMNMIPPSISIKNVKTNCVIFISDVRYQKSFKFMKSTTCLLVSLTEVILKFKKGAGTPDF